LKRKDRFVFSRELGERLRTLRERAGLTQQELAVAMGLECRGAHHAVSRFELAKLEGPSIGMVADFLRACRAGFGDILDLLDQYTGLPTVPDRAGQKRVRAMAHNLPFPVAKEVVSYDAKESAARRTDGRPAQSPTERVRRTRRLAAAALWRRRLHSHVVGVINTKQLRIGGLANEKLVQNSALKLWKELGEVRKKPQQFDGVRAAVEADLIAPGLIPEETVRIVLAEVVDLFRQAAISGRLDQLPPSR